ncbi:MAG: hypothetical protein V2A76_17280 [Planctomycetota bacterium]
MKSLFGRSGSREDDGGPADRFRCKLLSDPRVNRFFEGTDRADQGDVCKEPLLMASSGPGSHVDPETGDEDQAEMEKGLTEIEVDAVIDILGETLSDGGARNESPGASTESDD